MPQPKWRTAAKDSKIKAPRRALTLLAEPIEVLAAQEGDQGPRRFKMVANSGKVMENHWFWGDFALDMDGAKPDFQKMPILRDHDFGRIVGHSESVTPTRQGMLVEGVFSQSTVDAEEVQRLSDEGFPWQSSLYFKVLKIEEVGKGQSAEVNGFQLKGPATIIRKWRMREASFVPLGADAHTPAEALSGREEEFEVEITTNLKGKEDEHMAKEEQIVELEAKDKVATVTLSEFRSARSELVKEIEDEAAKLAAEKAEEKALKGERKRIADVCGNAPKGMSALALECLVDGKSVEEAKSVFLKALEAAAETTLGAGDEEQERSNDHKIELSVEDQAKKDYKETAKLREEFSTEGSYVAFKVHEDAGDIKILSSKKEE